MSVQTIRQYLKPLRRQILTHPVYERIRSIEDLSIFMEHHVFAVWDFMSLLKRLQNDLTCTTVPWIPRQHPHLRRFINEIVLAEESDKTVLGVFSHFELYRDAMLQCGASVKGIDGLIRKISSGKGVLDIPTSNHIPIGSRTFVASTWDRVLDSRTHAVASAFTFGREDLIPDLFRKIVSRLSMKHPGRLKLFRFYLERHIGLDKREHSPLAFKMLNQLCGDNPKRWAEALESARVALEARKKLWDGVYNALK